MDFAGNSGNIMQKQELYRITSRLYKELRSHKNNIIVKKMRGTLCGLYNLENGDITLDYRKELIPTLIHEYLHHWNQDKCETWILDKERRIVSALSNKQVKNIIKAFGESL